MLTWGIEGMVIGGIDIGVMEIGVIDIGVNVIDGMDMGVIEIGVYVSIGSVGTAPPENSLQLKSTQQPWTPLRITQWRPESQYSPLLQHSASLGAQWKDPQHL